MVHNEQFGIRHQWVTATGEQRPKITKSSNIKQLFYETVQ